MCRTNTQLLSVLRGKEKSAGCRSFLTVPPPSGISSLLTSNTPTPPAPLNPNYNSSFGLILHLTSYSLITSDLVPFKSTSPVGQSQYLKVVLSVCAAERNSISSSLTLFVIPEALEHPSCASRFLFLRFLSPGLPHTRLSRGHSVSPSLFWLPVPRSRCFDPDLCPGGDPASFLVSFLLSRPCLFLPLCPHFSVLPSVRTVSPSFASCILVSFVFLLDFPLCLGGKMVN